MEACGKMAPHLQNAMAADFSTICNNHITQRTTLETKASGSRLVLKGEQLQRLLPPTVVPILRLLHRAGPALCGSC